MALALKFRSLIRAVSSILSVSLYADSIFLMLSTFAASLLGFAFWFLAARFYTVADVGFGSVVVSATAFLAILATAGIGVTLIRFLPEAQTPSSLISACLVAVAALGLIGSGIYLAGLRLWNPASLPMMPNSIFVLAVVGLTVFGAMSAVMDSALVVTHKAKYVLAKTVLFQLLKVALVVPFAMLLGGLGISAAWCLALLGAVLVSLLLLLPRGLPGYRRVSPLAFRQLADAKDYLGASYIAGLLEISPRLLLPILIVNMLGPEQSAFFYIAWMFAHVLFAIPASVSCILFKEGSWSQETLRQNTARALKFSLLLLAPAILAVFLLGEWILDVFGGVYSANALRLVWILALSSVPMAFVCVYCAALRVTKQMRRLVGIAGAIAIGTLAASYFLLAPIGIMGVGYAWLAMQSAVGVYAARALGIAHW